VFHTFISIPELNFLLGTVKYVSTNVMEQGIYMGCSRFHYIKENVSMTTTEKKQHYMRFEALTVVTIWITVLWDVMLCSLVDRCRCFGWRKDLSTTPRKLFYHKIAISPILEGYVTYLWSSSLGYL
jgi:hypothetical protein